MGDILGVVSGYMSDSNDFTSCTRRYTDTLVRKLDVVSKSLNERASLLPTLHFQTYLRDCGIAMYTQQSPALYLKMCYEQA